MSSRLALGGLLAAAGLAVVIGVSQGPAALSLAQVLDALAGSSDSPLICGIRLPRVLLAVVTGASLALAGTGLQAVLRNPLADPGLLGVSAGAALGVATALVLGGGLAWASSAWGMSAVAFVGGLFATVLVSVLARLASRGQPVGTASATLVLAGVGVNALAGALLGILLARASDPALRALTFWTLGSLNGATWAGVATVSISLGLGLVSLSRDARALDVLQLGSQEAVAAGVPVRRLERRVVATSALLAGSAVALTGVIGFVGLVAPHLARLSLGPRHRVLVPAAALIGALLMVVADTTARTAWAPAELPVGILTALLGVPVFFTLIVRAGRMVAA